MGDRLSCRAISRRLDATRITPLRVILKPIIDFLLTESQTSHAHHPSYIRYRIPFKIISTKLAFAIFWWLGFAIAKPNIKLQFDFSTILRQDDRLLGFVP